MSILLIVNLAASAVLLVHAACMLNHMTRRSSHLLRLGYLLMAGGGAAALLGPFYGYRVPVPAEVLINIGAATALASRVWLRGRARVWR